MLALTPLNIAQIAPPCGHHNHSSFSGAFQRRYQLTPRDFRQALNHATPTNTQSRPQYEDRKPVAAK
ncbi:MAG: hypothetical protein ACTHZY_04265 [Halomonas sp.]|uniref:hypothetical protein n=1 Tax=unclassified Halomonas TaxID=2609666 RepID=UPI003FB8F9B8